MPRRKDGSYALPALSEEQREIIQILQYDVKFGKFVNKDVWVFAEHNSEPPVLAQKENIP